MRGESRLMKIEGVHWSVLVGGGYIWHSNFMAIICLPMRGDVR